MTARWPSMMVMRDWPIGSFWIGSWRLIFTDPSRTLDCPGVTVAVGFAAGTVATGRAFSLQSVVRFSFSGLDEGKPFLLDKRPLNSQTIPLLSMIA